QAANLCPGHWNAWTDDPSDAVTCLAFLIQAYPQPMLTDIEFDVDGSMILGFSDRWGYQTGHFNFTPEGNLPAEGGVTSGDILRVYNDNGTFVLESNGAAGPLTSATGVGNNEGPGGGEFYNGDFAVEHYEIAQGGLAMPYGTGTIASTAMDPVGIIFTGGVRYFSNTDGSGNPATSYQLYASGTSVTTFGKAHGLGDLELLCDLAPLEIGNFVWLDEDGDGIQDPSEPPLSGVTVELYDDQGTLLATTTTDSDGEYYFSADGDPNQIWETPDDGLDPNTDYQIRIPLEQPRLSGLGPTQPDYNSNADNGDLHDSDGDPSLNSGFATAPVSTGNAGENDHTYDFGFTELGAIGNRVWLDEDADGLQDAGEPGIPNVRVVLKDGEGNPVAETVTDVDGGYLFPNLPPGDYLVDVDETSLPPGMTQTPPALPNADFGNQDQGTNDDGYPLTLGPGEENLTADFGFNPNPAGDVNDPTGSPPAALGDRVWIDGDGDGAQDPNEPGVAGVELTLFTPGPDGIFDTPDDVPQTTTTTDATGNYLFNGLEPGVYKVCLTSSDGSSHDVLDPAQYDPTGDPDHFGQPEATAPAGTANDHCSTLPVVLGPGDVFLNVDFGYQPQPDAPVGSIGDTVWLDADADTNGPALPPVDGGAPANQGNGGEDDATETPIPGVKVCLVQDLNGDGVRDAGEPIIASDITDANGQYLFEGLPLDDGGGDSDADYIVCVEDTDNVLAGLTPTFDADGIGTPNLSARAISAGDPNPRDQDFGYTPFGHDPALGLIGDTIWLDADNSGGDQTTQGDEPGIEGVVVELFDPDGDVLLDTTVTDENGRYTFGGLPLDETYQVRVAPENFDPGGVLEEFFNTFDPDGGNDSVGPDVTLNAANPINLEQDFSYVGSGTTGEQQVGRIGNLVWLDLNANGTYEPANGETPMAGVTVDLYRDLNGDGDLDPGEPRLATTVTAAGIDAAQFGADGNYIFNGLPVGDYIVDVSDRDGVLAGYWQSDGPNDGQNNNSQVDPYAVNIAQGGENLTADFGYYVLPAAVGNWVWLDSNRDGIQNDGEIGINDVPVILTVTYPDDTQVVVQTLTQNDPVDGNPGWYCFENLLLDEDNNGDGAGAEPAFTIEVGTVPNLLPTLANQGGDDTLDSDASGVAAQPIQGRVDCARSNDSDPIASYDFGFTELGAIGNRVWLDEDADGLQDAGEPGIPNVRVVLKDGEGNPVAETVTDVDGGYLFPNLPPGDYLVDVDETSLPPGMTQTPPALPNADFGNQDQGTNDDGYPLTLGPGEENLTADFGFNPNPAGDVNDPTGSPPAALGDRVWIDGDGDGAQDPNEPGVAGVELTLFTPGPDGIFDTPDDVPQTTTTTDATGNYLFNGLEPGVYKVCLTSSDGSSHDVLDPAQYDPTGDPDHFGQPEATAPAGTANDHCSTLPVVLGPGDVFLNVDFGYQPQPDAPVGSIGDTVWLDADADTNGPALPPVDGGAPANQGNGGEDDATETPIPGVKVCLVQDLNGDGVRDAGEPIIASDITDANGQYLFEGLPLDDGGGDSDADYIVCVEDTDNVLAGLTPTFDADGIGTPNLSARAISAGDPNPRDQDFGYTPFGHDPALGLIGDTIWLDADNSGGDQTTQGDEPGIEGVVVELFDPDGDVLLDTTVTDENGRYTFGGLPLDETYQVRVAPENFDPGGVLEEFFNTFDPDGGNDSVGPDVTLNAANPINLEQDFSYVGSGTTGEQQVGRIGNLVWLDLNANGTYEPANGETPMAGVTVDLYRDLNGDGDLDPGEPRLATTVTAAGIDAAQFGADGNYIFNGLPVGDYIVDVSDRDGVLAGYWQSDGPNDGQNNNSQVDPYAVNIAQGGENLTADFGYYVLPAAVGNWVWLDSNRDGIQNDGEIGINDVPVILTVTYPDDTQVVVQTLTQNDPVDGNPGWYCFENLLLDEDNNGDGAGAEPAFTIEVGTVPNLLPTLANQGGDDTLDSDASGVAAQPIQGRVDCARSNDSDPIASYDFGFMVALDWGDNPDTGAGTASGNYNTTADDNGPSHPLGDSSPFMGLCVDGDDGTQQNITADADNVGVGTPVFGDCTNDEDG
ncbi:MAG: SdrD B-like domain-containing protein, partial [Litorilinea sp.]